VKRKHQGLVAIVLLVTALALGVGYTVYGSWQGAPTPNLQMVKPLPDVSLPEPATLQEVARLEATVKRLAVPPSATGMPVDLGLFGYHRTDLSDRPVLVAQNGVPVQFDYRISLAFYARGHQFCIIDGSFYQVGSVLPDKGRILKIEPKRVLIARHGVKRWIPLADRRTDDAQAGAQRQLPGISEGGK
jgi:hypothetical protein